MLKWENHRFRVCVLLTHHLQLGNGKLDLTRYPMVWCGAILPPMHHQPYTQIDNTLTRVWHKAYEDGMKETSSSAFAPSRAVADLSVYHKN